MQPDVEDQKNGEIEIIRRTRDTNKGTSKAITVGGHFIPSFLSLEHLEIFVSQFFPSGFLNVP